MTRFGRSQNLSRACVLLMFAAQALTGVAQDVHVSAAGGHVSMSISAQHPYTLMMGGSKVAVLGVQCAVKGKKAGHLITFQPGTSLAEEDSKGGVKVLNITLDGQIHETEWMPYGEAGTLAYYGKTEQERWAFLQLLMSSKTLAVEFKPFLTGLPVTAAFTLGNLRDEVLKHTECAGH